MQSLEHMQEADSPEHRVSAAGRGGGADIQDMQSLGTAGDKDTPALQYVSLLLLDPATHKSCITHLTV